MSKKIILALKIIASIILIQTLFFKFPGAEQSIELFTKIAGKNEAFMRIGTGILELIAVILLFLPKKGWLGGLLITGLMFGAIMSHITILGIEHNNDSGVLFLSACFTFLVGIIILWNKRKDIPIFGKNF